MQTGVKELGKGLNAIRKVAAQGQAALEAVRETRARQQEEEKTRQGGMDNQPPPPVMATAVVVAQPVEVYEGASAPPMRQHDSSASSPPQPPPSSKQQDHDAAPLPLAQRQQQQQQQHEQQQRQQLEEQAQYTGSALDALDNARVVQVGLRPDMKNKLHSRKSVVFTCPFCALQARTQIHLKTGCCGGCCHFCSFWVYCMCFFPWLSVGLSRWSESRDIRHSCPSCKRYVGVSKGSKLRLRCCWGDKAKRRRQLVDEYGACCCCCGIEPRQEPGSDGRPDLEMGQQRR